MALSTSDTVVQTRLCDESVMRCGNGPLVSADSHDQVEIITKILLQRQYPELKMWEYFCLHKAGVWIPVAKGRAEHIHW